MASTKKAYDALGDVIGGRPPAEFNDLTSAELTDLARILGESIDLHAANIAEAEDNVARLAPRPLRGTVRRMLGAER